MAWSRLSRHSSRQTISEKRLFSSMMGASYSTGMVRFSMTQSGRTLQNRAILWKMLGSVMGSSVRPFDLMMGKILGVASVAIVQVLLWGVLIAGVGALVMPHLMPEDVMASAQAMQQGMPDAASMSGMNPEMLQAVAAMTDLGYIVKIFVSLLLFVFGGYLLYSAMFAAVGSAVDNVQDASQLQMPITLPIILALLMMFVVIKDPNSQLAFWFSIIPFTSPIVMMARIPYDIPLWEVALSLVVLYASFVGMVWFAAKIYRVGIFMYGKKPSLKELFKWIRYKY